LDVSGVKPHTDGARGAGLVEEGTGGLNAVVAQQSFYPIEGGDSDLVRGFGLGYLHRRRLADEGGKSVEQPDDQRYCDGQVFPERITIHARSGGRTEKTPSGCPGCRALIRASSLCPWAVRKQRRCAARWPRRACRRGKRPRW